MRRFIYIFAALILALSLCGASSAQQSGPLTSMDFTIMGVGLNASPEYQAVPKGIASRVDTLWTSGGSALPTEIVQQLPSGFVVKAELTGPAYQTPLQLATVPGQPFDLPTLPLLGKYTLSNIRVFDSTGTVLFGASPQAVSIEAIKDPLITSVTTRPLSLTEIRDRGVVFDSSNFTAYEFTAVLGTQSNQVPISFPVLIPDTSKLLEDPEKIPNPSIGLGLPSVNNVQIPELPENLSLTGFKLELDQSGEKFATGTVSLPPIPGIVVIPGNIGFLHQYFSALAIVSNGAPGMSGLVVKDLKAKIILPSGADQDPGTDETPGDDPLRMAKAASGFFPRITDVMNAGPDGKIGTTDDISRLYPAESGQSDFTIEGLKEGTHKLDFEITATLEGLPIGPVPLKGRATGAVLVRNPDFTVTLGHPATVRSGEEYDLFVTITNTSLAVANLVSVHLDPRALSGAVFVEGEDPDKQIETILPGSSETIKYRLLSQRTGAVTATAFASETVKGRFILRVGVGELGIPLSPDSLIIPYTGELAPDLVTAAVGLLGQAWSVATAPTGALPATVLPIGKSVITARANDLSEAGLRILMGDTSIKAVQDLAFDFIGSDNANYGFDSLRRGSTQGRRLNAALAALLQAEVETAGFFDFQAHYAQQASYRPGHISVIASEAPVRVQVSDAVGSRIGGLAASDAFREIPYSDQMVLSAECGVQSAECTAWSTLSLITKLESASYQVEILAGAPGVFDLGVVLPDAAGTLMQVRFSNVPVLTGSRGRVTLLPNTNSTYGLAFDDNGDGEADRTVAASSVLAIPDPGPAVVAVTQLSPGFGPGGDKHGRNIAVLFSERVTRETAQNLANYAVEENAVRMAYHQPSGRMTFLLLRDGVGPLVPRSITVSGMKDTRGNSMSPSSAALAIRMTAKGPAAIVKGTVRLANGQPVAGANIRLMQLIWHDDGFEIVPKYAIFSEKPSKADGSYQFDYVFQNDDPRGPFMIDATHPETKEAASFQASVVHHGLEINMDLFMKARGAVTGTVRDVDGNPVPGASVLITPQGGVSLVTTADATGVFAFTNVRVGAFSLKAVSQSLMSEGTTMGTLGEDGGTVIQDIAIYRLSDVQTGTVTGSVLEADGVSPRPGVVVIIESDRYKNWTRTDADGKYSLAGVFTGTVKVQATDEVTGQTSTATAPLTSNGTVVLNIILKGMGTLTCKVEREDKLSAQGLYVVASTSGLQRVAITDTSGVATFADMPVGDIFVRVPDPRNLDASLAQGTVTILSAGASQNITLFIPAKSFATGTIQGTVYKRDGSVYPFVDVYRVDFAAELVFPFAKTDSQGRYSVSGLGLGSYPLVVVKGSDVANGTANLWYDTQAATLDLTMTGLGTVTGTIYDRAGTNPDGTPAYMPVGADVILSSMRPNSLGWLQFDASATVKSDPQTGRYVFTGVYVGNVTVGSRNIFRPTLVSKSGVLAGDGQTVTIDLTLKETFGSISGQVFLPDGTTPAGEGIKVTVTYGGADVTVTTGPDGKFQFRPVIPAGSYSVTAYDEMTTLIGRSSVYVPAGQDVPVTVRLLGRGTMTIRTFFADGTSAPNADVTVKGTGFPNNTASGETDQNGVIIFSNLTEGRYAVSALGTYNRSGRAEGIISADNASIDVKVTLAAAGTVTGKFLKPDGVTPVPGGQIKLKNAGGQVIAYGYSSSGQADTGAFKLEYIPLGDFKLEGYDPVSDRIGFGGGRIVSDGQSVAADIIVTPQGTVKGTVLNNQGTAPVDRATVDISVTGVQGWSYTTVSAPDGSFIFAGVPAGSFSIRVKDPATGLQGTAAGKVSYEGEIVRADVRLQSSGTIEGTVYLPGGKTTALNADVCLSTINCYPKLHTDGNGQYRFINLVAGRSYPVYATETGTMRAGQTSATITSDGEVVTADVVLQGIGVVEGRVFDTDGTTALPDAKVTIGSRGIVSPSYIDYSDASGNYRFTNVPAGSFTLQATHPERLTAASASGTLTNEGQAVTQNLTLGPVGAITGTVLMPDATTPARGGGIKYTGCGRNFTAVIDTNGLFQFDNVPLCSSFTLYIEDATGAAIGYASGSLVENGQTLNAGTVILDDKAIAVAEVVPATGAVNVAVNTQVTVFLSEPARASTINTNTVYLLKGSSKVSAAVSLSADGRNATITPSQTLTGFTLYTVVVTTGVEDLVYRRLGQTFTSIFTTVDNTPPAVTTASPLNNAVEVAQDGVVRVTFSESIDPAFTSGIKLQLGTAAVNAQLDLIQGNTVAILSPVGGMLTNSTYTIFVSGVKDMVGNELASPFLSAFKTIDTIAPAVTGLTYPSTADLIKGNTIPVTATVDSTDVAFVDFFVDNVLVATDATAPYTQNVLLAKEGTVYLKAVAQDKIGNRGLSYPQPAMAINVAPDQAPTVAITAPAEGSTVNTGSSFTVTVTATDDLHAREITLTASGAVTFSQTKASSSGKTFTASFSLTVPQNAVPGATITLTASAKDSAGQASRQAVVSVSVHDSIAPLVSITSPGQAVRYRPGETGTAFVTALDNIGITRIDCTASGAATGTYEFIVSPTEKQATRSFEFTVSPDAAPHAGISLSCIAQDGTVNKATTGITIYVADVVPPVVKSSSISDGAVDVPVSSSLTMTFDEPLAAATVTTDTVGLVVDDGAGTPVSGTVSLSNDRKIVTFKPQADLAMETAYRLTITTGVADDAGNNLSAVYQLRFTTIPPDRTPPAITQITPADGATGVSVASSITVRFSETINPNTVTKDVFLVNSASGQVQGAITFSQNNTVVTFRPLVQLGFVTDYTITLKAGIQDVVGNATTTDTVSAFKTGGFAITSPKNSAALIQGRKLDLTAVADSGQGITSVKFYVDNSLVGTKTGAPYTLSYTMPQTGQTEQLTITAEGITTGASIWAPGIAVITLVGGQDSDGDGLTNDQEVDAGTDPLTADAYADPDNDGLTNMEEISLGTDPNNADTDNDGLTDYDEVRTYQTSPLNQDTDADGLKDGEEVTTYFTSPTNPDTDADGLGDGWEVKYGQNLTILDPTKADTDNDGTLDGEEDPDADGLRNKWEYCLNLDPTKARTDGTNNDKDRDGDRDGWTNIYEVTTGSTKTFTTSACLADTDGDGVIDPDEKNVLLTDPNNKNDLYGTDFTLSGGKTIRIEGKAYFNNLTITGNSTITTLNASTTQVSRAVIEVASNLNIDAGSKIDVSARGYVGGWVDGNNNTSTGRTLGNTTTGGSRYYNGGSYGGLGGIHSDGSVNGMYGDPLHPADAGSGGGGYYYNYQGGGNGGGVVRITAGSLALDGSILAEGTSFAPGYAAGGGSGGSIWIEAGTLSGVGTISVKGGSVTNGNGGAGGGGRIAVYYSDRANFNGTVSANGGSSATNRRGGAGTVYWQSASQSYGETIINNNGVMDVPTTLPGGRYGAITVTSSTVIVSGSLTADTLSVQNGSVLTVPSATVTEVGQLAITATTVNVDSTSKIDVIGKGYLGGWVGGNGTSTGRTYGNTTTGGSTRYNGGGYGGLGGIHSDGSVNVVYGGPLSPMEPGSGGGGYYYNGYQGGGNGGGVVRIKAGSLVLDGSILAEGTSLSPGYTAGGGSGGSIWIEAGTLSGVGTISVKGGSVTNGNGGAGGGGRIAIYYDTLTLPVANIVASGGVSNTVSRNGGAGTVYLKSNVTAYAQLIVDNRGTDTNEGSTPLPAVGRDAITSLAADSMTNSGASWQPGVLKGLKLNPNTSQDKTFTIINNDATTIFIDPAEGDLTQVAAAGNTYTGVYTLDQVSIMGKAKVLSADRLVISAELTVDGSTLTLNNNDVAADKITVKNSGLINHLGATTTTTSKVALQATTLFTVDATSRIDVTGRGYLGGWQGGNNTSTGRTLGNTTTGGSRYYNGGSYGGLGGIHSDGSVNVVYGGPLSPMEPGSGGGGYYYNGYQGGGNGGGVVRIKAGSLVLDGSILAEGTSLSPGYTAGGGSGGSIWIEAGTLSGVGTISVKGGSVTNGNGGAGGGGRVAIYYDIIDLPTTNITSAGGISGSGGTPSRNGGAGTVHLQVR